MIGLGASLIILGTILVILSFLGFGRRSCGSLKVGPFSASGMIGFLIMVLGVFVDLIEKGFLHF